MTSIASQERTAWILAELRSSGSVSLDNAARELAVSEMTIRRDLRLLENDGHARRIRGGAIYTGPVSFRGRERTFGEQKRIIAEKLLPLVPRTGMIAFDSSSTMNRLASCLIGAKDLIVVTNSIETMNVLRDRPGIEAILTGGFFDQRSDSLVGPIATHCVAGLRFDAFFASASAVDIDTGCFEDTLEEADIKRAMSRSANRVVIGATFEKLGRSASFLSVRADDMDVLATEIAEPAGRLPGVPARIHVL